MVRSLMSLVLVGALSLPSFAHASDAPAATPPAGGGAGAPVTAASTTPVLPEVVLLNIVKALNHDDFKQFLTSLSSAQQAQIQKQWSTMTLTPKQSQSLDAFLTKYLAANAVDQIISENKDAITGFDVGNWSQKITMGGALLPMILAQGGALSPAQQLLVPQVQQFLTDIGAWLPTAGLNDVAKVKQALLHVQTAVKALGVTSSAQLHQLAFADLITRLGLAHHELKLALTAFGVNLDALLASVAAHSSKPDVGDPLHRSLTVDFTAFGHPYSVSLPVVYVGAQWQIDPAIVPDSLTAMIQKFMGSRSPEEQAKP